jgi:hypothetical protein
MRVKVNEYSNEPRMAHPFNCKCDGCIGARKVRENKGVAPKSGHWYSKYSGK